MVWPLECELSLTWLNHNWYVSEFNRIHFQIANFKTNIELKLPKPACLMTLSLGRNCVSPQGLIILKNYQVTNCKRVLCIVPSAGGNLTCSYSPNKYCQTRKLIYSLIHLTKIMHPYAHLNIHAYIPTCIHTYIYIFILNVSLSGICF